MLTHEAYAVSRYRGVIFSMLHHTEDLAMEIILLALQVLYWSGKVALVSILVIKALGF